MSFSSTLKKTLIAGTVGASILALSSPGFAAPFEGPTIDYPGADDLNPSPLPNDVFEYPDLEPSPGFPDTDDRPVLVDSGCFGDAVWMVFSDPDGPDLRMTVKAGYGRTPSYNLVEVDHQWPYHNFWSLDAADWKDGWLIVQATDEDGHKSVAHALKKRNFDGCYVAHDFDHGQDTDFWEATGVGT